MIKSGFVRSRKAGGNYNASGLNTYYVQNGQGATMRAGDPVRVSSGKLKLANNTTSPVGVVEEFYYIDNTSRQPVKTKVLAASTSSAAGTLEGYNLANGILALVDDDPKSTFLIQANTSVGLTSNGALARVTGAGTGNAYRSTAQADITGTAVSAGNAMVRIVGVPKYVNYNVSAAPTPDGDAANDWGITGLTVVEVIFSNHLYG